MLRRDWQDIKSLGDLRDEMENMFSTFAGAVGHEIPARFRSDPAVNLFEDAERFCAEFEVPGLTMDRLDVEVLGDQLTVKGRRAVVEPEHLMFHRRERATTDFSRTLRLPASVVIDGAEAVLKDGVLTVTMPKSDVAKATRVEVKSE